MKYWIAVASREHAVKGKEGGFMQVCHGKQSPLKRLNPGDWIVYYSPKQVFEQNEICRKFTVIGRIKDNNLYQHKMSDDFIPWRRDVDFLQAHEVLMEPLIDKLSFIKNKKQWGFVFRYGLLSIPFDDFELIASSMGVNIHE
jgi:predicted RNA-binding protein